MEEDSIIRSISEKITKLYDSYYQFGDDEGCWFNEQKEKDNKKIMLSLLNQLIERLNEINDGTFIIEDIESERLKNLRWFIKRFYKLISSNQSKVYAKLLKIG